MHLIPIGNSLGIRIPKPLIQQAGFQGKELSIKLTKEGILLEPVKKVRLGWAAAFADMHATGDDVLLDEGAMANEFDKDEWTW